MMAGPETDVDLRRLFPGLAPAPPPVDVADITMHSADVSPGGLFLACAGARHHGLQYLDEALQRGPRAVVWEPLGTQGDPQLPAAVCGFAVPGLRQRLGDIANRFFASPSAEMTIAGITGTNGKTTVAWLLAEALETLGQRSAYMGTLGYGPAGQPRSVGLTTPDCVTLHRRLRSLADDGARHVALEVSSHALDQGRVDGVRFGVVAFTNLSRDHLDYHRDMASYARAKERLFLEAGAAQAVINAGDEFGRSLLARLPASMSVLTVGVDAGRSAAPAMLRASRVADEATGQRVALSLGAETVRFSTPLVGVFNLENLAVAAGILLAQGHALEQVGAALASCTPPPGRMERVSGAAGPCVIVDFAHTPAALERVLSVLRARSTARLWCVFGCGGDRDAGKRPAMGAAASALADRVIVTDDNPRSEDPATIVAAVLSGIGGAVEVIHDRREAIRHAILSADAADVVLIAGKGHETGQVIGVESRPFCDRAVARAALAERT